MNKNVICFVGLLMALPILVGCPAGSAPDMQPVTGMVTFDGKPVEEGRVQFREVADGQRSFSGMIANGTYTLDSAAGPMRVEVLASRIIPGKFDESNPGVKEPMGEMYIPAKFNSRSELTADVPSGGGAIDFTLTSS